MSAVYVSRPVKQFSGSRQPLPDLALEGFEALLSSGGPPPELLLITSAHPLELAGVPGPDVAAALARRARELSLPTRVEFYANPGLEEPTAHLAASAAGAALFHEGTRRVSRGEVRSLAVLGVEQMRLTDRERTTECLRSLIHPGERASGMTIPALGALLTRRLESEYPGLSRALTALTLANRSRTVLNPRAHMRKSLRLEEVATDRNPLVSDPLRLFDVAPTSSGYAGLYLTTEPGPLPLQVVVAGIGRGLDRLCVSRRAGLSRSRATREAMDELLSGLEWDQAEFRRAVTRAEIHDAFPIIEFLGLVDSGLTTEEEAVEDILAGAFDIQGRCPVNALGGVMGGHPIAATGIGQIVELYLQSTGRSEIHPPLGYPAYSFALNVGGPLTYNCVSLLCAFERDLGPPRRFRISPRPHAVAAEVDRSGGDAPPAGSVQVLSATKLEFPPPGFGPACRIALVASGAGSHVVPCLHDPPPPGGLMNLIRTNGHMSAVLPGTGPT